MAKKQEFIQLALDFKEQRFHQQVSQGITPEVETYPSSRTIETGLRETSKLISFLDNAQSKWMETLCLFYGKFGYMSHHQLNVVRDIYGKAIAKKRERNLKLVGA